MNNRFLLFITFSLLLCSCKETEVIIGEKFKLFIESSVSNNNFIMVSDQTGSLLYSNGTINNNSTIEIEHSVGESVDVTIGRLDDNFFDLTTYRSVPSGFTLVGPAENCLEDYTNLILTSGFNTELRINGINSYQKLYYHWVFNREATSSIIDNQIILKGLLQDQNSHIITILPNGSNTYLSLKINFENWMDLGGNNFELEVDINDFQPTLVANIESNISGELSARINGINENGHPTTFSTSHTYLNPSDNFGFNIPVFQYPKNDLTSYSLNIFQSNSDGIYYLDKEFSELPAQITMFDPDIEVQIKTAKMYQLEPVDQAELVNVTFKYQSNGNTASWAVFQLPGHPFSYLLPDLPERTFDLFAGIDQLLGAPVNLYIEPYSEFNVNIEEMYYEKQIDWDCLQFKYKHVSDSF